MIYYNHSKLALHRRYLALFDIAPFGQFHFEDKEALEHELHLMPRIEIKIPRYDVAVRVGYSRRVGSIEAGEFTHDASIGTVKAYDQIHRLACIAVRVGIVGARRRKDIVRSCRENRARGRHIVRTEYVSVRRTTIATVVAHVRTYAFILYIYSCYGSGKFVELTQDAGLVDTVCC